MRYDAVVLAGGTSRRLGGGDKTRLTVGGSTLLDRVLTATATAVTTIVVGEPRPTCRPVKWVREQPPGAGPAAATAAALPTVTAAVVALLAADLPFLSQPRVRCLVDAVGSTGAVAVDHDGHPQWLISAWPMALLRRTPLSVNGSLRTVLGQLRPVRIAFEDDEVMDCDTPLDLRRARALATDYRAATGDHGGSRPSPRPGSVGARSPQIWGGSSAKPTVTDRGGTVHTDT